MKGWEGCYRGLANPGQGDGWGYTAIESSSIRRGLQKCGGGVILLLMVQQTCLKGQKGLFRRSFQFQYLPCTNEINSVGPLFRFGTRIEQENRTVVFVVIVLVLRQQVFEFDGKSIELPKIEWTKIERVVHIDEFLVHSEVLDGDLFLSVIVYENFGLGRWRFQGTIVQSILYGGVRERKSLSEGQRASERASEVRTLKQPHGQRAKGKQAPLMVEQQEEKVEQEAVPE